MSNEADSLFTVFVGSRQLAHGTLAEVALKAKKSLERGEASPLLVFEDATGRVIDLDLRGNPEDVRRRHAARFFPRRRKKGRTGAPQAGSRFARDLAVAAPLAVAGFAARRRFGDFAQAR